MGREWAQQALLGQTYPFRKECCPRSSTHSGTANHEPLMPFLSKSCHVGGYSLGKHMGQSQLRGIPVGCIDCWHSVHHLHPNRGVLSSLLHICSTQVKQVPAARSVPPIPFCSQACPCWSVDRVSRQPKPGPLYVYNAITERLNLTQEFCNAGFYSQRLLKQHTPKGVWIPLLSP